MAMRLGNTAASIQLAALYLEGNGVLKDVAKAVDLLQQAHDAGDTEASRLLGIMVIHSTSA